MNSRIIKVFYLLVAFLFISNISFAFNPDEDCTPDVTVPVSNLGEVEDALANPQLKEGKYIICYQITNPNNVIEIDKVIQILGKDNILIIHGLYLKAKKAPPFGNLYEGLFLSIEGPDVIFSDVRTEDAENAINITGSHVTIQDSNIQAKETGISIAGQDVNIDGSTIDSQKVGVSIENANYAHILNSTIKAKETGISIAGTSENITIKDTAIIQTGESAEGSKGVYVDNANAVEIKTGAKAIEDFEYAVYVRRGEGVKVTETNFKITDPAKAIFWESGGGPVVDVNVVGKKLDEEGKIATRIAGLAPGNDGYVELYIKDVWQGKDEISFISKCPITEVKEDEDLCIYYGLGKIPDNDEECKKLNKSECECFERGEYKFDCADVSVPAHRSALFAYTNVSVNTYQFSDKRVINNLGNIIASVPALPIYIPTGGQLQEGSGGSDLVSGDAGDEVYIDPVDDLPADEGKESGGTTTAMEGSGGGDLMPTGGWGSRKIGCSLNQSTSDTPPLMLMTLLIIPLILIYLNRIRIKQFHK